MAPPLGIFAKPSAVILGLLGFGGPGPPGAERDATSSVVEWMELLSLREMKARHLGPELGPDLLA